MKLATLKENGIEKACFFTPVGWVPLERINRYLGRAWPTDLLGLLQIGALEGLQRWYGGGGRAEAERRAGELILSGPPDFAPLYRRPRKIWGIGLNYRAHAADLDEQVPQGNRAASCGRIRRSSGRGTRSRSPASRSGRPPRGS